jgi:hypothetical protein
MNANSRHRGWIASLTLALFLGMLASASVPLQAGAQAVPEQPGAVEKMGQASQHSGASPVLTYVLVGAGVLAAAAVLIFVVFKSGYDIRGTWQFEYLGDDNTVWYTAPAVVFSGSTDSGTVTSNGYLSTYTVNDKTIVITEVADNWARHNATFSDKDHFSGTWTYTNSSSGNFRATRTSSSATAVSTGVSSKRRNPDPIR